LTLFQTSPGAILYWSCVLIGPAAVALTVGLRPAEDLLLGQPRQILLVADAPLLVEQLRQGRTAGQFA
jgi:hypothetical protein